MSWTMRKSMALGLRPRLARRLDFLKKSVCLFADLAYHLARQSAGGQPISGIAFPRRRASALQEGNRNDPDTIDSSRRASPSPPGAFGDEHCRDRAHGPHDQLFGGDRHLHRPGSFERDPQEAPLDFEFWGKDLGRGLWGVGKARFLSARQQACRSLSSAKRAARAPTQTLEQETREADRWPSLLGDGR